MHAFVSSTSSSPSFIIDSGASGHVVSARDTFSSLDNSKGPKIILGDESVTNSLGNGRIDINHGSYNDFFYVPGLACNVPFQYF